MLIVGVKLSVSKKGSANPITLKYERKLVFVRVKKEREKIRRY